MTHTSLGNKKTQHAFEHAFALPTVLIVSVILLMLLVTGISSTVAVNNGLRDQYYTKLAELASDAGTAFAYACLTANDNDITWTDETPLRPNTDCNGVVNGSASAYVLNQSDIRTYFVVGENMEAKGYTEGIRTTTNLAWRVWTTGSVNAVQVPSGGTSLPAGTSIEGYWTTAPTGYLLEDGACVSKSTYQDLFNAIGTFGAACPAPSTEFRLPDSRGKNTIARNTGDTTFNTVGNNGGEKSHLLTIAEMPSHTHVQNAHSHNPPVAVVYNGNAGNYRSIFATNSAFWSGGDGNNAVTATVATNQNTGGGGTHNVLDPYIVVTRAVKY